MMFFSSRSRVASFFAEALDNTRSKVNGVRKREGRKKKLHEQNEKGGIVHDFVNNANVKWPKSKGEYQRQRF